MTEKKYPYVASHPKGGFYYLEKGPNSIYVNFILVEQNEELGDAVAIVGSVAESPLMNSFTTAAYGKVIQSIPLSELLEKLFAGIK